jgi:LacI family transcriptional regulator
VRQPLLEVGRCLGQAIVKMIGHEPLEIEAPELSLVVRESVRQLGSG